MPLLLTSMILPLIVLQKKPVLLEDIAGKTFAELGEILGKPVRSVTKRGFGEWRDFTSPFPNSELVTFYQKEGELVPGQIQLIFRKGSTIDWGSALKLLGFSISGASFTGTEIQGVKTDWELYWYDRKLESSGGKSALSLGVPRRIKDAATKRIAQIKTQPPQQRTNFYTLMGVGEEKWEEALGKKLDDSEEPAECELENPSTGETQKAFEWTSKYGSSFGVLWVTFRGKTSKTGLAIKVGGFEVGDPSTFWERIDLPKDQFSAVALAPRESIPDYMDRAEYRESTDKKFVATLFIYKDTKKRHPGFTVESKTPWVRKYQ